ncbi:MAG: hypothetical protein DLM63_13495 [Solirubrobacterales bacterium]|nr:MAG: hypothetical protein DLM63_13495 [Solirubrobacterales bacterium]
MAAARRSRSIVVRWVSARSSARRGSELTQHAAALPELAPRVRSVELMVERIIVYLDTLQPTVDELTHAAADLQRAVDPIGRIAGPLPGSKARQLPADREPSKLKHT